MVYGAGGDVAANGAFTLNNPVTVIGGSSLTVTGNQPITFANTVYLGNATNGTVTLNVSDSQTVTFSNTTAAITLAGTTAGCTATFGETGFNACAIVSGPITDAGTSNLTKAGLGTLVLSSSTNAINGCLNVGNGILLATSPAALSQNTAGCVTVASPGALVLASNFGTLTGNKVLSPVGTGFNGQLDGAVIALGTASWGTGNTSLNTTGGYDIGVADGAALTLSMEVLGVAGSP